MAKRETASVDALVAELCRLGDLRVWSVIISIIGDAVMPRGGVVPASALSALTERLSIKPEAMRVALYRLAKDGWITRRKSGRNSFYELSDKGRDEFLPASRRIYALAPALDGPWRLAALPQMPEATRSKAEKRLRKAGYLALTSRLYLGAGAAIEAPGDAIQVDGQIARLPDWARDALAPEALQQDYADLETALSRCRRTLDAGTALQPLDAAALRTLLVHRWRRLLLRHADLPLDVLPVNWRGEACRALFLALHDLLSEQADAWLDEHIGPRN